MDTLPDHLIIEILNRLDDSIELARCKLVSKTLYKLARQVHSIHLYCSLDRYKKMRSPFKTIFNKLISEAEAPIESVYLGVDELARAPIYCNYDLEEEGHDLFLTAGPFSEDWMIFIQDFWPQSGFIETDILEVISYHCHSLVELTLKNASMTSDDMHLMPLLTRLTLINVVISDESLNKLMECVPCLEVLNLIDSGGDTDPKIHHLNLKELKWTLCLCPGAPEISFITVFAPNLTKLELKCYEPKTISIYAPLLSYFHLSVNSVVLLNVEEFVNLKTLTLESSELSYVLVTLFTRISGRTVQNLTLDSTKCEPLDESDKFSLFDIFTLFPNVTSLTLGSEVWSQQMVYPSAPLTKGSKGLKQITVYVALDNIDRTLSFILYVAGICTNLSDMELLIHRDVDMGVAINFVSSCMSQCSKVRWRWGTWKKGPYVAR